MVEPTTYRIAILPDVIKVELVGVGSMTDTSNNTLEEGWFNSVDDLPPWAQERLALLMMSRVKVGQVFEGIGRRISEDIFWIYA